MQQVVLTIEDHNIEQAMDEIAHHEGLNIQELIMQAIRSFIRQKSLIKKLDPLQHSTQICYEISEENDDVKPFAFVKDSAAFGKDLRESIWKRTSIRSPHFYV